MLSDSVHATNGWRGVHAAGTSETCVIGVQVLQGISRCAPSMMTVIGTADSIKIMRRPHTGRCSLSKSDFSNFRSDPSPTAPPHRT